MHQFHSQFIIAFYCKKLLLLDAMAEENPISKLSYKVISICQKYLIINREKVIGNNEAVSAHLQWALRA